MKAPWNEPRGYRTLAERQQARPVEKHLLIEAMKNGQPPADPLYVEEDRRVGYESQREARREDAKAFLFAGFLFGLGLGILVGVWLATR